MREVEQNSTKVEQYSTKVEHCSIVFYCSSTMIIIEEGIYHLLNDESKFWRQHINKEKRIMK